MAKKQPGPRVPRENPSARQEQKRIDSFGKRGKDLYNTFSTKVARAKVLFERGRKWGEVIEATGLSNDVLSKVKKGTYDPGIPAAMLERMRAAEDGKLTLARGRIIDEILESDVIEHASLMQLATAFGILTDKQELLAGRPTSRVDTLIHATDEEIESERQRVLRELLERAEARGEVVEGEVVAGLGLSAPEESAST
jgi:hypothetical protein